MDIPLLIILSPPRSFSSVISTMLGQHPELYGFPELHLFIGDTLQEVLDYQHEGGNYFGPPGLLRAIAELEFGGQTSATVARAIGWLFERRHWSTKRMLDYLCAKVAPRIAIEKSPVTALKPLGLERAWTFYPHAYFLHLTRHPVSTRRSMDEFLKQRMRRERRRAFDSLLSWYRFHCNILEFTQTLPAGQSLMIKGEDLLSDPDRYLVQIAEWLGIRTDKAAIEAMKHPECSPYAHLGPFPAFGGNDDNFMRHPHLRPGRVSEPSLHTFFAEHSPLEWLTPEDQADLAELGYELLPEETLISEVSALAHRLGYH